MNNTVKDSAIKKLKLLITVVNRPKGEFYLDVLGQYNVNFQMVTNARGRPTPSFWSCWVWNPTRR